jgi:hypothetical protein
MNKTQHNGIERNDEQIAVAQEHLAGLQAMDPAELVTVEGGIHGVTEIPSYLTPLSYVPPLPK